MRVPLACYTHKDHLNIIHNKQKERVEFPILPVCYIKDGFELNRKERPYWKTYTDLWTKQEVKVYEKEFYSPFECAKFYREHRDGGYVFALPYLEYLMVKKPEFFEEYANTDGLTLFTFDIEVYHAGDGRFPTPERDPILCIGYKVNDNPTQVIKCFDTNKKISDKMILEEFFKIFNEVDPDVVIGYNCMGLYGEGFDIPYIINRAQKHGINPGCLSRWGFPITKFTKEEGVDETQFYGRVIFDIYNSVLKDQSLMGIKNKRLKTVAKWYGIQAIELDVAGGMDDYIGKEELFKYVTSDVDITYELFKIYFPLYKTMAEMMKIPLENAINAYSSFIPKIFNGRHLLSMGYLPFQSNATRHPSLTGVKFQAALTNLILPGLHKQLQGVDVASFYPSLMRTFNLSPETVELIGYKPLTENYVFRSDGKVLWVEIPDNNLGRNVFLKINLETVSYTKREIVKFFDIRNGLKEQIKKAVGSDKLIFKSQSDAIKVIMNCFSGDTNVKTVNGIKNIKDCKIGDQVYSINPKTLEVELATVIETQKYFSDKIYSIKGKNIDFLVTGNHRFLTSDNMTDWKFKMVDEFKNDPMVYLPQHKKVNGTSPEYFSIMDFVDSNEYVYFKTNDKSCHRHEITKNKNFIHSKIGRYYMVKKKYIGNPDEFENKYQVKLYIKSYKKSSLHPWKFKTVDFLSLLGWYISEGSIYKRKSINKALKGSYPGKSTRVIISQDIEKNRYTIQQLLNAMHIPFSLSKKAICISDRVLAKALMCHGGDGSYNKFISKNILSMNSDLLQFLYNSMMLGDGDKKGYRYTTVSKQLAEDFSHMVFKLGMQGNIVNEIFNQTHNNKKCSIYRIYIKQLQHHICKENIKCLEWNNDVHCITLDKNNTIFAGRNTSYGWVGQSIYGVHSLDTTWLGDFGVGIAIAGLARWILGEAIKHLGPNVIAYDTDGLYVRIPVKLDELNAWTAKLIYDNTKAQSFIRFDDKGLYDGYFYKTKNYILKKPDGKYERHGVSMKSSRAPLFYDEIINVVSDAIFSERSKPDLVALAETLGSLNDFQLEDFLMRTKVTKLDPGMAKSIEGSGKKVTDDIYKNANALQPSLLKRAREKFDRPLGIGDYIEYYKSTEGYVLKDEVTNKEKLDMKYYRALADTALAIFNLDRKTLKEEKQLKLDLEVPVNV